MSAHFCRIIQQVRVQNFSLLEGWQTVSLVLRLLYHPPLKYFQELQIRLVTSMSISVSIFYLNRSILLPPPPPPPPPNTTTTTPMKSLIVWFIHKNSSQMVWFARGFYCCWKGRQFSIYYTGITIL